MRVGGLDEELSEIYPIPMDIFRILDMTQWTSSFYKSLCQL